MVSHDPADAQAADGPVIALGPEAAASDGPVSELRARAFKLIS
jgi:hypothetical protein